MSVKEFIQNENKALNKLIGELEDIQARLSMECMWLYEADRDEKIVNAVKEARNKTVELFGEHAKYLAETPVTFSEEA